MKLLIYILFAWNFSYAMACPHTTITGIELIKKFEGLRLTSYRCPAGVWTIGYGHTKTAMPNQRITKAHATALLIKDLRYFECKLCQKLEREILWYEFDALISWTYNLGPNRLNGTILNAVNNNNPEYVTYKMNLYVYANGKKLRGLVRRRQAETNLYKGIF